eukprot:scaffold117037_cov15-Prasinocladus_malaysianus.AAC.2
MTLPWMTWSCLVVEARPASARTTARADRASCRRQSALLVAITLEALLMPAEAASPVVAPDQRGGDSSSPTGIHIIANLKVIYGEMPD